MKRLVLIGLLAFALFLSACTQSTQNQQANTVSSNTTPTTSGSAGLGSDWCTAGASWSYSGASGEGYGSASWTIKGLESFKGKTYCHATYVVTGAGQQQMTMEAYFDKDSKDVWIIVKDATGKQISEQHVTGS